MSVYRAILGARFRALLQYRAAAVAGIGTQLFWGVIRVMIFTAFYHSTTAPQPLSLQDTITYLWLTQAMFALAVWNVDPDVRGMIRDGTVAYELLRPLDLYSLWYSRALAGRAAPTFLRAVPLFAIAGLFLGLRPPASLGALSAWGLATLFALLLAAALSTLITITLLYTISGEGIVRMAPLLVYSLSGMLIPLPLMPAWARPALDFLPFRDMVDIPYRLYLGQIPPAQIGVALAHQALWTVVIIHCGRVLLARAGRRLVVQGG